MSDIQNKLHLEFAKRSLSASFAFILCSAMLLQFHFTEIDQNIIYKASLIGIIFANCLRVWSSKQVIAKQLYFPNKWPIAHLSSIIANAIFFSIIFSIAMHSTPFSSHFLILIFVIYCGVAAGSVSSLSLFPPAQIFFIIITLFIPIIYFGIRGYQNQDKNILYLSVGIIGFNFFIASISYLYYKSLYKMYFLESELKQEKKKLEESLEEIFIQKARTDHFTRLAAIGEMAKGLAHELNNPLSIIKGHNDKIKKSFSLNTDHNQQEILNSTQKIDKSIDRISELLQSLKLFSQDKIITSNFYETYNLNKLFNDCLIFFKNQIEEKKITVINEINQDIFLSINVPQLTQAFNQLIDNSIDALKDTSSPHIYFRSEFIGDFIKVYICDNGPGVPIASSEDIFLPFFTTKDTGNGTGLGLSIAKGIIEQHQGVIALEKNKNDTIFSIKLPTKN